MERLDAHYMGAVQLMGQLRLILDRLNRVAYHEDPLPLQWQANDHVHLFIRALHLNLGSLLSRILHKVQSMTEPSYNPLLEGFYGRPDRDGQPIRNMIAARIDIYLSTWDATVARGQPICKIPLPEITKHDIVSILSEIFHDLPCGSKPSTYHHQRVDDVLSALGPALCVKRYKTNSIRLKSVPATLDIKDEDVKFLPQSIWERLRPKISTTSQSTNTPQPLGFVEALPEILHARGALQKYDDRDFLFQAAACLSGTYATMFMTANSAKLLKEPHSPCKDLVCPIDTDYIAQQHGFHYRETRFAKTYYEASMQTGDGSSDDSKDAGDGNCSTAQMWSGAGAMPDYPGPGRLSDCIKDLTQLLETSLCGHVIATPVRTLVKASEKGNDLARAILPGVRETLRRGSFLKSNNPDNTSLTTEDLWCLFTKQQTQEWVFDAIVQATIKVTATQRVSVVPTSLYERWSMGRLNSIDVETLATVFQLPVSRAEASETKVVLIRLPSSRVPFKHVVISEITKAYQHQPSGAHRMPVAKTMCRSVLVYVGLIPTSTASSCEGGTVSLTEFPEAKVELKRFMSHLFTPRSDEDETSTLVVPWSICDRVIHISPFLASTYPYDPALLLLDTVFELFGTSRTTMIGKLLGSESFSFNPSQPVSLAAAREIDQDRVRLCAANILSSDQSMRKRTQEMFEAHTAQILNWGHATGGDEPDISAIYDRTEEDLEDAEEVEDDTEDFDDSPRVLPKLLFTMQELDDEETVQERQRQLLGETLISEWQYSAEVDEAIEAASPCIVAQDLTGASCRYSSFFVTKSKASRTYNKQLALNNSKTTKMYSYTAIGMLLYSRPMPHLCSRLIALVVRVHFA